MNSLIERMKVLKRIVIEPHEDFVVEVNDGIKKAEFMVGIDRMEYQMSTGKSNIRIRTINPHGFGEPEIETIKYVSE
jgi:hypothetical protein